MSRASGTDIPATGTDIGAASPAGTSEPFLGTYRVTNMIAVQNYMDSGATFLQSLLDGHPGILNTPVFYSRDIHGAWIKGSHFPAEDGIDTFIRSFPAWFDPRHVDVDNGVNRLGDNGDETSVVNPDEFRRRMLKILEGEKRVLSLLFIQSAHPTTTRLSGICRRNLGITGNPGSRSARPSCSSRFGVNRLVQRQAASGCGHVAGDRFRSKPGSGQAARRLYR